MALWSSRPPGGTPTTRGRVFGNLRHCYKPWSSLGWEKVEKMWRKCPLISSAKQHKYVCNGTVAISGMRIIIMILLVMATWLRRFCLNTGWICLITNANRRRTCSLRSQVGVRVIEAQPCSEYLYIWKILKDITGSIATFFQSVSGMEVFVSSMACNNCVLWL